MFNLSGSEIIVILLLALVVLGPEKLPEALRRAGRTYAELKKMGNSFQTEMRSVLDEPMKEMRDTADLLRKAVDVTVETATTDTRTPCRRRARPSSTNRCPRSPAATAELESTSTRRSAARRGAEHRRRWTTTRAAAAQRPAAAGDRAPAPTEPTAGAPTSPAEHGRRADQPDAQR